MPKAKLTTRERTTSNVAADNLNKGSELSFAEADSNFINLRDRSWGLADDTSTVLQVTDDKTITIAGGTNVTTALSGDTLTINATGAGGDIGNLEVTGGNFQTLAGTVTNAPIIIQPNGTGEIHLQSDSLRFGLSNTDVSIISNGRGDLKLRPEDSDNLNPQIILETGQLTGTPGTGHIYLKNQSNGNQGAIYLNSNDGVFVTSGNSYASALTVTGNVVANAFLAGNIDIRNNDIINTNTNGDINITPNGTGKIVLDGLNWPTADGSNGQFLITDGAGNLSFSSTSLTTFGDLTAVGSTITAPSNADLTLATSGSGDLVSAGNHRVNGDLEVDVIRPEAAGNDIHLLGLDDGLDRSYVKLESHGVWIKGNAELAMDHSDSIGSGGVFHSQGTQTQFNKGKNDIQNFIIRHNQSTDSGGQTTSAIFHIETYADRGRTNGNGMVTIGDSGMAQAGSPSMIQGQGTENFNVFGTARLENVFFKDNKIYTDRSNEDLEIECSGTGTIDLKLPTSSTIGSNGGASALTANPVGYVKIKINGTEYQIPYYNV